MISSSPAFVCPAPREEGHRVAGRMDLAGRSSRGWPKLAPSSIVLLLGLFCALGAASSASAGVLHRSQLESGVHAAIDNGRVLFIEVRPPQGDAARGVLQKYLADPNSWTLYRGRMAVAIPYLQLNETSKRRVLEALFPEDYVDEQGWWHRVSYTGAAGQESLFALSEWLTGVGTNSKRIAQLPENQGVQESLQAGQVVLVPMTLLLPAMRKHSPKRAVPLRPATPLRPASVPLDTAPGLLEYGQDGEGAYAIYRLKKGEALYSSVVVRFTDFHENADVHAALKTIQRRSRIPDINRVEVNQPILIPMDMLSDRYQPAQTAQRQTYEAVREQALELSKVKFNTQGLDGVVLILDPGHGGRDHGASWGGILYEDEIAYDIACRIKKILETQTKARVYMTLMDTKQGFEPTNARKFVHDTNEVLLTTPRYDNTDAKISANLRWYLANKIYREELKKGTDERKILFASIHCDALFNEKLRGTMVYIPGAEYRPDRGTMPGPVYASYQEVKAQPTVTTDAKLRRRDEAVSLNFARALLQSLATHNPPIKVHDAGDPIRNVIRQSGGKVYVPAVLRNTMVPTKVLVETANVLNAQDRERLLDPEWRQAYAEAFVGAMRNYYR